jgi:hypothetical protein
MSALRYREAKARCKDSGGRGRAGAAPARAKEKEAAREVLIADLYPRIERDYKINQKKSAKNVKAAWDRHLRAVFGNLPARQFDPELVENYITDRQAAGAQSATINRELAVLKRMASLALEKLKTEDEKLIASLVRWSKIKSLAERNVRKGFVKDTAYEALARETGRVGCGCGPCLSAPTPSASAKANCSR